MALTKNDKTALMVGGGLLGGALLYYLMAGAGSEKNAALIPDAIEDRLDLVVKVLDRRFGKVWVDRGISALKSALSETLPGPVVALVDAVVAAEKLGRQQRWTGAYKRVHAMRLAGA
jgi:hypothetical protein